MSKELKLLNGLCIIVAIGFIAFAIVNAFTAGSFLSTDNLFVTLVCLVMALIFAVNPLLYLKSEGKLPIPFMKSSATAALPPSQSATAVRAGTPPPALLDAKGRAVPPDVRAMVSRMGKSEPKDA